MKRKIISLLLTVMTACSLLAVPALAKETDDGSTAKVIYYVAKNGNDSNPGTIDEPFATIDKARDAIRDLKQTSGLPDGGVTVYVREGVYERETSLEFTLEDSGEEDKRITYSAYPGEKVEITGGKYINGGDFKKVTDQKLLDRLYPEVRDKLVYVNLKDYGYTDHGTWTAMYDNDGEKTSDKVYEPWELGGETLMYAVPGYMVFYDDEVLDIARVPNRIASGENEGMWDYFKSGKRISTKTGDYGGTFVYTDDRIDKWETYEDVAVYGFWNTSWKFETSAIQSVDFSKQQITLRYPLGSFTDEGRRYVYLNVFEELDTESEYFIDKNTLNLYMLKSDKMNKARIGITKFGRDQMVDHLVYFNGASNITFRGFTVTLARTNGIYMKHTYNNLIDNCEVKNIGYCGVGIGGMNHNTRGMSAYGLGAIYKTEYMNYMFEWNSIEDYYSKWETQNNGITNSVIKNTGGTGVVVTGGNILECEPSGNYIENCEVAYTGRYMSCYGYGIDIAGCGVRASHNTLHDTPEAAFLFNGTDMIIEWNDIYHCMIDGSDYAVFYSCGWTNEMNLGTELRYNYIHNIPNTNYPGDQIAATDGISTRHAFYNDNGQPFLKVHHNVVWDCPTGAFQAGCSENNYWDNIFVDVLIPIENTGQNQVSSSLKSGKGTFWALGYSNFFNPRFTENEKFKEKYPEFEELRQKMLEMGNEAWQPVQDISDNVFVFYDHPERYTTNFFAQTIYTGTLSDEYSRYENNYFTTEDPGFVDINAHNFKIKENAKILETHPGLASIDTEKTGRNISRTSEIFDNSVVLKVNSETAYKFGDYKLVDSENANVAPIIKDSRTLVPVRFIAEALDSKVDWDADIQTVTITKGGKTVTLKIGDDKMNVDGETVTLDVFAQIIEGRTMIPVRAIAEAFNKKVTYQDGLIIIGDIDVDTETDSDWLTKILERF